MRSVTIARGRLITSRLGFGTSALHHLRTDDARAGLLHHCYEQGISHFDTAPLYGHQLAERQLGRFLKQRRQQIVLSTKFGIAPNHWYSKSSAFLYAGLATRSVAHRLRLATPRAMPRDYGEKSLRSSLERSLKNLGTDHVDVLFAHDPTSEDLDLPDETLRALDALQASGKVRFVGLSGTAEACLRMAQRHPQIAQVLQIEADAGLSGLAHCKRAGLNPEITFGHLRSAGDQSARARLERAAAANPNGVILFSSRSVSRIDEVLAAMDRVEQVPQAQHEVG